MFCRTFSIVIEKACRLLQVYCRLLQKHDSLLSYEVRWGIWLHCDSCLIHKIRKFYYKSINQLLRRDTISFLDWTSDRYYKGWQVLQMATIIMKCERTECANVWNKIYRKKSHLLSPFYFFAVGNCFEVVQGLFSNGKALGTR